MKNKVLENEDLLKKINWQRKTYPLKLNLTDIQQSRIDNMIYEYKKCINKAIDIILNDFFKNHISQIENNEIKEGICPLCQKKKKLNFLLRDFKFELYKKSKNKENYKPVYKKNNEVLICEPCHCSHYSLRKFLTPSKDRNIPILEWDFTLAGNLYHKKFERGFGTRPNIYDSCLQKAVECIKSQVEIKKKLNYRIKWNRERLEQNQISLNVEENKKHKDNEEIKKLRNYIKYNLKMISKLEKRYAENIEYKQNVIRLYENSYNIVKEDNDFFIKLKNYSKGNIMTLSFYGEKYQKKLASGFINNQNAETEILNKNGIYYLQYVYKKEVEIPVPDETFTAVGVDVNLINIACLVSMAKNLKPLKIKFYSGRHMRNKRTRFKKLRKIWNSKLMWKSNGGKGKSRKWFLDKCEIQNEKMYVKYVIHSVTTSIAQYIKDNIEKPVIVMEKMTDIRDRIGKELKIQKCSMEKLDKKQQKAIRTEKLLNSEINNWNFADFQSFLEYKANWLGIPVIYVPAKNTSLKCNKCGNIQEENYKDYHSVDFHCKKCGYRCNADFNASVNLARLFFENLQEEKTSKSNSSEIISKSRQLFR